MSWIEKMTRKMPEAPSVKQLRSFGLVVGGAFWFIGVSPLLHRHDIRGWAIALGVAFVIPALALPMALRYPYRLWMLGGYGLGWINTRVILMLLFYLVFTPISILMRVFDRDSMSRNFDAALDTYRVLKKSRPASHLRHQF